MIASRIFLPEPAAASLRLAELADALAGTAHVVVMTTTAPKATRAASTAMPPVTIKRFPVLRDRSGYVRGYLQYLSFDIPLLLRLLASTPRPDVVVCEPPPTTGLVVRVACAIRRIPYVYYAADLWSDASAGAGAPAPVVAVVRAMECAAVRGATRVLSVSDGVTARLHRWRRDGIATIGHGIDTAVFHPTGAAVQQPGPYFLYAGTASEVHGATVFLEAFRQVLATRPDARLVFIGQGADFATIREAAAQLPGGAVRVLPRTSPGEVAQWIRGAVATLASVRPGMGYDYAVPTKANASIACGTPVILAGPSPLADTLVEHHLGWSTDYAAPDVAAAMLEALAAPPAPGIADRLSGWAEEHLSSRSTAAASAQLVLEVAGARLSDVQGR